MRVKTKKFEPEIDGSSVGSSRNPSESDESLSLVDATDEESGEGRQGQGSQQSQQSQEIYEVDNEIQIRASWLSWIFNIILSFFKWFLKSPKLLQNESIEIFQMESEDFAVDNESVLEAVEVNQANINEEAIIRELANMDLRKDRVESLKAFDDAAFKLGVNITFQAKLVYLSIVRASLLIQTFENSVDHVQDLMAFALKGLDKYQLDALPILILGTIINSYRRLQTVCQKVGVDLCSFYHFIHMTEVQRLASFFVVSWEDLRMKDSSIEDFLRVVPCSNVQGVEWPRRSMLKIFNEYLSDVKIVLKISTSSSETGKYLGRLESMLKERIHLLASDSPSETLLENFGLQSLQANVNYFSSSTWHLFLLDWMADHFRPVVEIEDCLHSNRPAKELILRLCKSIRNKNPIEATATSIHRNNTYYRPYVIFLRFLISIMKSEDCCGTQVKPCFAVRLVLKTLYDGPISMVPSHIYYDVINSCYEILPVNLEPPNEENLDLKSRLDCLYRHLILIQQFPLEGIGITFSTLKRATEDQTSAKELIRAILYEIPITRESIAKKVDAIHQGIGSSLLKEDVIRMTISYLMSKPDFTAKKEEKEWAITKSLESLVLEWKNLPSLNPGNNDRTLETSFFFLEETAKMFFSIGNIRPVKSDKLANARCALKFTSNLRIQSKLFNSKLRSLQTCDVLMATLTNLRENIPRDNRNVTSFYSFESLIKFFSFSREKENPTEAEKLAIVDCDTLSRVPILTRVSGIEFTFVILLEWPQLATDRWQQMKSLLQDVLLVKDDETSIRIRISALYEIHKNYIQLKNFEASKIHLRELCKFLLNNVERAMNVASYVSRDQVVSANAALMHPDILQILKKCVDCPYGKDLKSKTREFCEKLVLENGDLSNELEIILDLASPDLEKTDQTRQVWSEDVLDESLIQKANLHNLTTFLCLESAIKYYRSEDRDQKILLMCVAVVKELDDLCSTKEIKKVEKNRFNPLIKCPLYPNINPCDIGNLLNNLRTINGITDEEIIFIGCWMNPERRTPFLKLLSAARSIRIEEDSGILKLRQTNKTTKIQNFVSTSLMNINRWWS
eukprot:GHVP01027572.1.p2 GENE.GHVP01027572.1~~GHVP01027572.1.p2  ORF type:complete len:1078 (+),score=173.83 GHVP01027572.1:3403-6636(+)